MSSNVTQGSRESGVSTSLKAVDSQSSSREGSNQNRNNEDHDHYEMDDGTNKNSRDVDSDHENGIPHMTHGHRPSNAHPQPTSTLDKFHTKDMPDWPSDADADGHEFVDFDYLDAGMFSPGESLRIFGDDQLLQLDFPTNVDPNLLQSMSAKGCKDLFSDLLRNDYDVHNQPQNSTRDLSQPLPQRSTPVMHLTTSRSHSKGDSNTYDEGFYSHTMHSGEQGYITPVSLTGFGNGDSLSNSSAMEVDNQPCRCLQRTATMLEDIEMKTFAEGATSIDAMMNFHQESLGQCDSILSCSDCLNRSEKMMLLVMVLEKLVSLIEKACCRYVQEFRKNGDHNSTITSTTANDGTKRRVSSEWQRSRTGLNDGTSSLTFSPFCGQYKVRSTKDWACIINVLLSIQLKTLDQFVKRMRQVPFISRRESHLAILSGCEHKIERLRQGMCKP